MPSLETVMSAQLMCTNGTAPSELIVDPIPILVEGMVAGTIIDGVGEVNIQAFGTCTVTGNSCTPLTAVWLPGNPTVLMCGAPALAQLSVAPCAMAVVADAVAGLVTGGSVDEVPSICIVLIVEPNNFTVFV